MTRPPIVSAIFVIALTVAACGGSDDAASVDTTSAETVAVSATPTAGITLVSPQEAASTVESAPEDLVILDVRTPEEFAEGHIDGATMLDFYRDDFAAELAKLDRDVPYVLYCRSGNRSGQARQIMDELGFTSVQDVEGGVINWQQVGLPLVTG